MALRGTLTHRKIRTLARLLDISPCFALGIVESLWHVTAEQAPSGNIGRMSDEDLAMEMFYDADAKKLVLALIGAKLLDTHPTHRLVVHDWHLHADDATDNKIARQKERYASGEVPRMKRLSKNERDQLIAHYATPCAQNATESHEKPLPVPEPEPVPDPEPVPEKQVSEAKASSPRTDSGKADPLEEIYKAYPRKVGKKSAIKAIARAIQQVKARGMPIREAQIWLYHRVQEYARSPAGNDGEFTPHPGTWFNQGRYDDSNEEWQRSSNARAANEVEDVPLGELIRRRREQSRVADGDADDGVGSAKTGPRSEAVVH
jgi:hypothetical protein